MGGRVSGWAVALALWASVSSGCFRWRYDSPAVASFPKPTVRTVAVGSQDLLSRVPDGDTHIVAQRQPMCRDARFGRRVTVVKQHRRLTAAWWPGTLLALAGGGAGIALVGTDKLPLASLGGWVPMAAYGLATLVTLIINPDSIKRRITETEANAAEWAGPEQACGPAAPVAGVKLRFRASFHDTTWYWFGDAESDRTGSARWDHFVQNAERVAAFCGAATLRVSDTSGIDPPPSLPTAPFTGVRRAPVLTFGSPAAPTRQLEGLPSSWLSVAQKCEEARIQTCKNALPANEIAAWQLACEEDCGAKVDATACVFGRRNCAAQAGGNAADRQICENGFRQCLIEQGIAPDAFLACGQRCVDERKAQRCP